MKKQQNMTIKKKKKIFEITRDNEKGIESKQMKQKTFSNDNTQIYTYK